MAKTTAERIAERDERITQLQNEKKQLLQRQKADERKARTSRLCRRHGLLEKYMPDLISITDEQFETFVKRGIDTSYGQKILAEIVAEARTTASPAIAETNHLNEANGRAGSPKAEPSGA